ncbi:hypothetical protein B0H17DRAFT_1132913 [Mycena rosella]|uniref:Uncharacterized protein n=1 Tax=Mycena rosella TaxID=1033263 RepID=A0AAD7DJ56_MYCRO|nr:hypothetical protein B0H17DRAFT_1132913 [Mycena rosella]
MATPYLGVSISKEVIGPVLPLPYILSFAGVVGALEKNCVAGLYIVMVSMLDEIEGFRQWGVWYHPLGRSFTHIHRRDATKTAGGCRRAATSDGRVMAKVPIERILHRAVVSRLGRTSTYGYGGVTEIRP